jgi:hypothetical protein
MQTEMILKRVKPHILVVLSPRCFHFQYTLLDCCLITREEANEIYLCKLYFQT